MKLRMALFAVLIVGIFAQACQAVEPNQPRLGNPPDDLKITYRWDTGSLPPKYHYSYEIVIEPDGSGQFIVQTGYAAKSEPTPWVSAFIISPEEKSQLFQLLMTRNILRTEWAKGKLLIGGSSSEMQVTAAGKTYSVPNDAQMIEKDKSDLAEVYDFIKQLVPKSIWDKLAQSRHQIESATDMPAQ